jgi:hypothetical protein
MEKVKVVKAITGILNVGDVLISPVEGADFCLEETVVTKRGSSERFVSLDYVTVSENVPQFFQFEQDFDDIVLELDNCFDIVRTEQEIQDRYEFFTNKFNSSEVGSEAQIVYKNLMWFIEWLNGKAEILG